MGLIIQGLINLTLHDIQLLWLSQGHRAARIGEVCLLSFR
jgi:hypothetical protein